MSRYTEETKNGQYKTTIASMDGCKYDYNEVCCNVDNHEILGDFCTVYTSRYCPYFVKEDGVIEK